MKGIYFNGTDAVYNEDLPMPLRGEKQSLVKILLCAVCNTDKEDFSSWINSLEELAIVFRKLLGRMNKGSSKAKIFQKGSISHPITLT